jgi:DNA anti-recombination protein RmuC
MALFDFAAEEGDSMRLARCVRMAALAATLAFATGPAGADEYQDAVDRAHTEVDKFEAWMQEQIAALKQEIADLEQELQGSDSSDKDRIDEMLKEASKSADDLGEQAKQIGASTSDQWDGVKASALSGWHRVQSAYYAALAELRGEQN